jgi:uncharacterized protein
MPLGMETSIGKDSARDRYELRVDGEVIGELDYTREGDSLAITHTGVRRSHRGRGLAGELVDFALRDIREAGLGVLPYCSYVSDYIRRHPEHLDLVPADRRPRFGLRPGG